MYGTVVVVVTLNRTLTIGGVALAHNIVLAPMAGVADTAFRSVCGELGGCGLMYTEMISAKGLCYNDRKSFLLTRVADIERPVALQLFGSEPDTVARAIELLNNSPADFFDINMGCPMPKITKNGDGSALMRNPELAQAIMKAAVRASKKPVTAKIRKGWDLGHVNAVEIAKRLEDAGAAMIAVHGRTREQLYGGRADWDIIADVKRATGIPIVGNGDVRNAGDAARMLDQTGCDGVMIGRAARGRPWIFRDIAAALSQTVSAASPAPPPSPSLLSSPAAEHTLEPAAVMRRHLEYAVAAHGERTGILEMRKHIAWYVKGMYGAAALKNEIFQATDYDGVLACIARIESNLRGGSNLCGGSNLRAAN